MWVDDQVHAGLRTEALDSRELLFAPLKRLVTRWIKEGDLECTGGTFPAQVRYLELANMAAKRIRSAVTESLSEKGVLKAHPKVISYVRNYKWGARFRTGWARPSVGMSRA